MIAARFVVEQAGPLTTIQDAGRPGCLRYGVPRSGPVDRLGFAAANTALGNHVAAAAIELSLGGLILRCTAGEIAFAVCGGDFSAEIDGVRQQPWSTGVVRAGSQLRIREGKAGNWGYLAFAGDVAAVQWLGSRSTHARAALGGGLVVAGRQMTVSNARMVAPRPIAPPPVADTPMIAQVIAGPQERFFADDALSSLAGELFRATSSFDRMGMLLDGPPLIPTTLDMPSEPAVRGALQVNGEGRLTLLLADHQPTGGYPKLAVVAGADIDRLAQMRAGQPVRFVAIGQDAAIASARRAQDAARAYLQRVAAEHSYEQRLISMNLIDGAVDATRGFALPDAE